MKHQYSILKLTLALLVILLSQNLSSQCTFGFETDTEFGEFNPQESIKLGQSFIAKCDGLLKYVQFISSGAGTLTSGTLKVFKGNGTAGTPIYEKVYAEQSIVDGRRPVRVDLVDSLPVKKDSLYTFQLQLNDKLGVVLAGNNQYSDGNAFDGEAIFENLDFFFEVSIEADSSKATKSLSVDENEIVIKPILSPNPSTDFIQVSNLQKSTAYQIFNVLGKEITQGVIRSNENIDLRSFNQGLYFLKLENETILKFVKQ